jgi:acetyl esterase/lipase
MRLQAETITVSLAELDDALVSARGEPDSVKKLVLDKIQQAFDEADLSFSDGALLVEDNLVNQTVEDGCTSTVINQMRTVVEVAADSALSLQLDSLFEPVTVQVELNTILDVDGTARQTFGFRLGSCQQLARDTFTFTANGPLSLRLSVMISLNPVWVEEDTLRLRPSIALDGELLQANIQVDADDSVLRSLLEDFLQDEVEALLSPSRLNAEIAKLQDSVNEQLQESLRDEDEGLAVDDSGNDDSGNDDGDNAGTIDIVLPAADDEQIVALYELLTPVARFPLTTGFITENRFQLLAALLLDDTNAVEELLQSAAECELTNVLQTDLPLPVAYNNRSGACELETDFSAAGTLYSDAGCTSGFDYYPTALLDFCNVALSPEQLGNAAANSGQLQRWTLSPGTRFDVGALSISGKQQPYVQRQSYKQVQTAAGVCDLEMRIYSADASAAEQNSPVRKALIALHGGSWQYRGTGFLGVENMATHFTDAGFVVFAPFYRLVGDSDGTEACHSASLTDLLSDVDDALAWVNNNKETYGAAGKPVLFGQSAGGHLAASLAVRQPQAVERSVLFYAPVDFEDFAEQIKSGAYDGGQGRRILEAVTGQTIDTLDLNSTLVQENTFTSIVAAQPDQYPQFFMLHGESDSLLPSRQSERLCDALAGTLDSDSAANANAAFTSVRKSVACDDRGSQLHLIAQGEHTLDLCISDELCLSGSPASARATADVIQSMIDWSAADTVTAFDPTGRGSDNGGSGRLDAMVILTLAMLSLLRCRFGAPGRVG